MFTSFFRHTAVIHQAGTQIVNWPQYLLQHGNYEGHGAGGRPEQVEAIREAFTAKSVPWAGRAMGIPCLRCMYTTETHVLQKVQENDLHRHYRSTADVLLWTVAVAALIGRASLTRLRLAFRVTLLINFRTWGIRKFSWCDGTWTE
jgi:hypothetical protein